MRLKLTSLVLLLTLGGGALAGVPMHSSEHACPMGDMDCCKKAAMAQRATPQVTAARLCCALNCSQDGTAPSGGINVPQSQPAHAPYVAMSPAIISLGLERHNFRSTHGPPTNSPPAYVRNLALLI
jgi:hypothetical protein